MDNSTPIESSSEPWNLRADDVSLSKVLSCGNYGTVWLAIVYDRKLGIRSVGAAKTVKNVDDFSSLDDHPNDNTVASRERNSLKKELDIYKRLRDHPSFPKLIGAVQGDEKFIIITEYVEGGDLRKFLLSKVKERLFIEQPVGDADYHENTAFKRIESQAQWASRFDKPSPIGTVTSSTLVYIALQIANALKYLIVDLKVLHRDIAARNVLITRDFVIKITDFGLARDDDYEQASLMALPFPHLALETLQTRKFTTHSEIWQFGVLLFEIFSLGKIPYNDLLSEHETNRAEKLLEYLEGGGRLMPPQGMPEPIKRLMANCFLETPEKRPTFEKIIKILHDLLNFMSSNLSSKIDALSQRSVEQPNRAELHHPTDSEGYLEPRLNRFKKPRIVNVGPRITHPSPPVAVPKNTESKKEQPRSSEFKGKGVGRPAGDEENAHSDWVQVVLNGCDIKNEDSKITARFSRAASAATPSPPHENTLISSKPFEKNGLKSGTVVQQDETINIQPSQPSTTPVRRNSTEILLPPNPRLSTSSSSDTPSHKSQTNVIISFALRIIRNPIYLLVIVLLILACVGAFVLFLALSLSL